MSTTEDTTRPADVLACPMGKNDAGAATIRDYLIALLARLWTLGEDFGAKRPFGNSGWESEVYGALVRQGLVSGSFDEDGYLDSFDDRRADQLVADAIQHLAIPEVDHG